MARQFVDEINLELGEQASLRGLKRFGSSTFGRRKTSASMAAAFARSPEFAARPSGMIGKIIRRISEWEGAGEADLLSYILFRR